MNKLILARYKMGEKIEKRLFTYSYEFNEFFNPFRELTENIELENILVFEVKGKNYKEKAESLQNLAIKFQEFNSCSCDIDLSMSELINICGWLEQKAARFGLVKEFRRNGIKRWN